jgi:putative nucleotidyltransferase with HDIG domain
MQGWSMRNDYQKLQQVIELGLELEQIQDIDILLEKILRSSRTILHADAGTIYIRNGNELKFSHTQNDALQSRLPPGKKLIYKTFSIPINHGSIAGYVASTGEIVNIPDVYQLNGQTPYAFDRSFDEKAQYQTHSMLTIPLKNNLGKVIGVMQLINARDEEGKTVPFIENDVPIVRIFANNATIAIERALMTRAEIIGMVHFLTEIRDPEETEAHVNRVGAFSAEIYEGWARKKGLLQEEIEAKAEILRMAAMLHDIGKLAIPRDIREKPGKFTAAEYEVMQQHTIKGARMLLASAQTAYEEAAAEIALNHHEYWNGTGYPGHIDLQTGQAIPGYENGNGKPRAKQGEEIPVFGRVVAIADVYDALSCRRVFREALQEGDVLKTLEKGAGRRFDAEMIDAFFASLDTIRSIAQRFPDER